ncbi:hypothetical protein [Streptomyces sp. NPDC058773]
MDACALALVAAAALCFLFGPRRTPAAEPGRKRHAVTAPQE